MEHIGFIGGHGDLASDGYNWYVSGDIPSSGSTSWPRNRSGQWDSLDFTPYGGTYTAGGTNVGVSPAEHPSSPTRLRLRAI